MDSSQQAAMRPPNSSTSPPRKALPTRPDRPLPPPPPDEGASPTLAHASPTRLRPAPPTRLPPAPPSAALQPSMADVHTGPVVHSYAPEVEAKQATQSDPYPSPYSQPFPQSPPSSSSAMPRLNVSSPTRADASASPSAPALTSASTSAPVFVSSPVGPSPMAPQNGNRPPQGQQTKPQLNSSLLGFTTPITPETPTPTPQAPYPLRDAQALAQQPRTDPEAEPRQAVPDDTPPEPTLPRTPKRSASLRAKTGPQDDPTEPVPPVPSVPRPIVLRINTGSTDSTVSPSSAFPLESRPLPDFPVSAVTPDHFASPAGNLARAASLKGPLPITPADKPLPRPELANISEGKGTGKAKATEEPKARTGQQPRSPPTPHKQVATALALAAGVGVGTAGMGKPAAPTTVEGGKLGATSFAATPERRSTPPQPAAECEEPHMDFTTILSHPYIIGGSVLLFIILPFVLGRGLFTTFLTVAVTAFVTRWLIPNNGAGPSREPSSSYPPLSADSASVGWVNHALRALFPLMSTDVLAPFVDLLEDALIQQVPPIVTSVRLTGVSLGNEPVLLTSLRPITDHQWFQYLDEGAPWMGRETPPEGFNSPHTPTSPTFSTTSGNGHYTTSPVSIKQSARRTSFTPSETSSSRGFASSHLQVPTSPPRHSVAQSPSRHGSSIPESQTHFSVPATVITPISPYGPSLIRRKSRSASAASRTTFASTPEEDLPPLPPLPDVDEPTSPSESGFRKRDRLLRRLTRRKSDAVSPGLPPTPETARTIKPPVNENGEEVDGDAGQYVNYEVGFTYRRTADMKARGTGLHMLAFFGWGVRGVGGSEIPVYIDVVQLRGKVRVRLLLSASPPFVREASFSFVTMPDFDISARPLRAGAFNAMDIPLIKSYVLKSVEKVAGAFVAPKSYSMDVDRLLLGYEGAMRTESIGVFEIVIHRAHDLIRADTMGSCDPYVAVSYSKFNKPMFSTRTIVNTQDPIWEERAFILVGRDTVHTGEKLRLRVCDSDRFSADDAVGVVEVDVADLVEQSTLAPGQDLFYRCDELAADRVGMKTQGQLDWSVRFFPLWQMAPEEMERRIGAIRDTRGQGQTVTPWWLQWLEDWMEIPEWAKERDEKRKEMVDFFTGERMRDEIEAAGKPTQELPSGVLQFHIHQCAELELESLSGTFTSGGNNRRKSAASGKPALGDVIDRAPSENADPPSSYVEVHLNDKFVYRTRTKQVNPVPYFNAVSERFVKDWRNSKIVFVVKDERNREHNPILGVVSLRLKDVLKNGCQVTRWFPLVGGLGWGRLRISLLFKPLEMHLAGNMSSFETATFDLTSISMPDMTEALGREPQVVIETEYDRAVLHGPNGRHNGERRSSDRHRDTLDEPSRDSTMLASPHKRTPSSTTAPRPTSYNSTLSTPDTPNIRSSMESNATGAHMSLIPMGSSVPWEVSKPIRLAVQYRQSCHVLFSVTTRRVLKKSRVHAIASLRLEDCSDGEVLSRTVPLFETRSVGDAIRAAYAWDEANTAHRNNHSTVGSPSSRVGSVGPSSRVASAGPSPPPLPANVRLVGFINISFVVHPGVSRAHRKLCKRDARMRTVYDAWEATRLLDGPLAIAPGDETADGYYDSDDEYDDGMYMSSDDESGAAAAAAMHEDDTRAMLDGSRAHSKALHKSNRGIFQLKLARTGKYVKDKVEEKILSSAAANKLDRRPRGADLEPEHEGQSRL